MFSAWNCSVLSSQGQQVWMPFLPPAQQQPEEWSLCLVAGSLQRGSSQRDIELTQDLIGLTRKTPIDLKGSRIRIFHQGIYPDSTLFALVNSATSISASEVEAWEREQQSETD
ncbi:uncharacterized protein LOC125640480 isoform X3 [Caretta caretta]|uniref:uncharacterized protein LOC125640480 isoform X3 n=1 Tax=Caretta caretta TaxID=8467 RepID=UPI002094FCA8|nr:uncharacterized protein LOC125640480 isoform X2 [Caretta caretta]